MGERAEGGRAEGGRAEGGWAEGGRGEGGACCRCAHRRRASPLTCVAVCFLVLSYTLLGGFLFLALEGGTAPARPAAELRHATVERLWAITEDLNILYKENWTKLAAKELLEFQKVLVQSLGRDSRLGGDHDDYRWTFSTSFLYALTLITTIGHGDVTPQSAAGKLVAVAYACVGIPIVMVYLSTIGAALARHFRALYSRLRPADRPAPRAAPAAKLERGRTPFQAALNLDGFRPGGARRTCRDHTRVPIALSLLPIASYVALGTVVFHTTEKWTFVDGCYFSFASLATIGFGALRPGGRGGQGAGDAAVGACCAYILVGIVLVAMCFELAQDAARAAARGVAARCGPRARAVHSRPAPSPSPSLAPSPSAAPSAPWAS